MESTPSQEDATPKAAVEGIDWLGSVVESGFVNTVVATAIVLLALTIANRTLGARARSSQEHGFRNQIVMLLLWLTGLVVVILALPLEGETKNQLLNLLALILSATIALSSTTFLGNILAGVLLRSMRNFRTGDFLRIEGHFGRVTERGLFHTEIQTEDRDLTTLPNMYLVSHPMNVVRTSGTIISAPVSLGYDVNRERARTLLLQAAERAELGDPFVRIVALGDYSVEYRVGGLLTEVKEMLSRRTRLRAEILDALHDGGVEITSPAVLSTRTFHPSERFVPVERAMAAAARGGGLEAVAFDKADMAESVELVREELDALSGEREELGKRLKQSTDEAVRQALADELQRLERRETELRGLMESREATLESEES